MSLNIYQKLIEVRKSCPYLKKDNKGFQFNYVSSSQALGTLRDEMDAQGLLLVPSVTSAVKSEKTTKKGDIEILTELNMKFIWINAENPVEFIECPFYAQGIDSGEKGVGKALTYAEKYFLLKFFNIATDLDDPDSFQKKVDEGKTKPPQPAKRQPDTTPITKDQVVAVQTYYSGLDGIKTHEQRLEHVNTWIKTKSPKHQGIASVKDMTKAMANLFLSEHGEQK